ncbi:Band 4.1-like protein 1 [Dissostichus eleginoides]|uniref:Band 4.1-like protein 1 n=1 Tax=Dissostichus eleginoides TaxID=100907 RepID=A0AAD9CKK0_DISEL|nr:Band 4.1-like protein 1 [Dissostichus eleginoides]
MNSILPLFALSSYRLHNAFYPQDPSFSLTLLHVLSAPLHGLANAFVFGLDRDWWSLLSPTGMQLALQSRLCDRTLIGEYHPGAVRYTQADLVDLSDDDDDNDTNVLFYSPDMTLKDRGP